MNMQTEIAKRYGVSEQVVADDDVGQACESIRHLGFAVVNGGFDQASLHALGDAFDRARNSATQAHGGHDALAAIDEHNTVRLPLAYEPLFLDLAKNKTILEICRQLVAGYVVLSQQNCIVNPPNGQRYNQAAWHRDLPYQHFVSSRPLAINALFCLDAFTVENGATKVLPASHRQETFPSERFVKKEAATVTAPAGSFIVLDCMAYHSGGVNVTDKARRAVNHVYTIPHLRQQIDLPSALGDGYTNDPDTRRLLGYDVRTPGSVAAYLSSRPKTREV